MENGATVKWWAPYARVRVQTPLDLSLFPYIISRIIGFALSKAKNFTFEALKKNSKFQKVCRLGKHKHIYMGYLLIDRQQTHGE